MNDAVDAAYRTKSGRYAVNIIKAITSPEASSTTMRLVPRSEGTRSKNSSKVVTRLLVSAVHTPVAGPPRDGPDCSFSN
ncbi:hypothetical protein [Streptomyces canus]|uniref:hypothetical protein n=1 Tax=Streptomyces canus TaxID=58343 RepID=UPI00359416D2